DLGLAERVDRRHTGANWFAIDQDRASAALGKPAAELGGVETQIIAQHVEQWRVRLGRHTAHRAIHLDVDGHNWGLPTGTVGGRRRILLRLFGSVEGPIRPSRIGGSRQNQWVAKGRALARDKASFTAPGRRARRLCIYADALRILGFVIRGFSSDPSATAASRASRRVL